MSSKTTRSRLYFVWRKMVARCTDPSDPAFVRYGARGISVCERWLVFDAFMDDMAPSYVPGLTVERIDNDGWYSPGNCRWATRMEQQAYTRSTVLIEHNWMRLPAREWGRRSGVDYRTILRRIRRGLPPSEAMRLVACELTLRKPYASLPTQEPRHT